MKAEDILNNTDPEEVRNILYRIRNKVIAIQSPPAQTIVQAAPTQYPPLPGNVASLTGWPPNKIIISDDDGVMTTDDGFEFIPSSFELGSLIDSDTIVVTSATGTEITGLTIGQWYAIEGASGPWHAGAGSPGSGNYYDFDMSIDGATFSGHIGYDNADSTFHTDVPTFAALVEAKDAQYGRVYFKAPTTSVWVRVADVTFGDNTGTFGYRLLNATVGDKGIYLDDVEYTLAKLANAIHSASNKIAPDNADELPIWDSTTGELKNILASTLASGGLGWFNPKDYGAVGDGSTNDTTAFTNTVTAINSAGGGVFYVPPGRYLTSGGFTFTTPVLLLGGGSSQGYLSADPISEVICNSTTATLFTFNADYSLVKDISLLCDAGGTPTTGAGIYVTNGSNYAQRVNYEGVTVRGFYRNIWVGVGATWYMHGCYLSGAVKTSLRITNTVNVDAGDWEISACWFYGELYNSDELILVESSGNGKIHGCKFNQSPDFKSASYAVHVNPTSSATGTFQFWGNSVENVRSHGIYMEGNPWHDILIYGNQFGLAWFTTNASGNAININGAYTYVVIALNTFRGGTITVGAISLASVAHAWILGNININFPQLLDQSGCTDINQVGTGTVTSVALTVPAEFSVAGSPITSTGTLAVTKANQNANLVYAGPSSGSAAAPTFRALTTDDLPAGIGSSGAGQVSGIARWNSGGGTTFDLPDIAESLLFTTDNGSIVDPLIYSLSSDRTQIIFDSSITAGHIVTADYIIAQV